MVPENKEWAELIKRVYEDDATQVIRYAIKKEPNIFDYNSLKKIVDDVSEEYKIKQITKDTFDSTRKNSWSRDLCSQFKDYDDYCEHGIGVVAIHNGEVVSGASSYTVYQGGIEIEIDTKEDYRRRGLALACGAKLILKCMDKNWYPSWDAQNKASVALAEKLGYHFDKEYIAYEVVGYGEK
jgi:predicted GNAT family acetyltransferase